MRGLRRAAMGEELAGRYARGATITDLVAETGRSYGFVRNLLVEGGAVMRHRGGGPPHAEHNGPDGRTDTSS